MTTETAPQTELEATQWEVRARDDVSHVTLSKPRAIALVITLTGASFLNVLSTQAIVVILPVVRKDLGVPESQSQWLISSYSLTFGCFLLIWGRIGDVVGRRQVFILGTALAAVSNTANPFLKNHIAFNVFRGLAGIGGAANVPTAIGILGVTFKEGGKARNYAFATFSAGSAIGGAVGNLIAGFISAYTSWKWVFGTLAACAAVIAASGIFTIPSPHERSETGGLNGLLRSVDWLGGFLVTASLTALLFALTEGNVAGWKNVHIPVLIVIAALLLATFGAWQWYQEARTNRPPLMSPSLFRNWSFTAATGIMGLFWGCYNAFVVYATYFWQDYQGLNTLQTTLRFIPQGVAGILVAFTMSFLISRVPTCTLLVGANLAVALSCLLFAIPIPSTRLANNQSNCQELIA
ncbi:MFS general substrate transporter [Zopfia rhizophila CBS 207.26]|uniref:MFS general substrate transporter n=1 Tax=Zopfia rhizophila CBS 207.26 TaxID=1314779 RepID=A0A6A6EHJ6_9PEZI|nr:MFS general substrate transporter [Zopfia rhizophila CBS 207.26]